MRELIFVDTETTGLNCGEDRLVELTYARIDGEPKTLYFGVTEVPEFIDNLIKFSARGIAGRESSPEEFEDYYDTAKDNTMVAANPAFDKGFLDGHDIFDFHYRMLDIETYAMAVLQLNYVPSMKEITDMLRDRGFKITEPDHTSRNDVLAMRDAFKALVELNGQ